MISFYIKDGSGNWVQCEFEDIAEGQFYRKEYNGRSVETYKPRLQVAPNRVRITGLTKNGVEQLNLSQRVVISKGTSLGVTARFETAEGVLIPLTDFFGVPIYQLGGTVDQTVGANFVDGTAQLMVEFPHSGEYVVNEQGLNLHLPEDQKLSFDTLYISVLSG